MLARRYAAALRQGHGRKLLIVGVGRQIGRYCRGSIDQPASDEYTDSPEPNDGHGEQRQLLYLAHAGNYSVASCSAALPYFPSPSPFPSPPCVRGGHASVRAMAVPSDTAPRGPER